MGSVFKRDGIWLLKFKDGGDTWVQERTKAQSKTEAKALLVELERRAERQRHGLEPLTQNPEGWTLADLMRWWLETYSAHLEAHEHDRLSVRSHLLESPLAARRLEQGDARRHRAAPPVQGGELRAGHHQPRPQLPRARVQQGEAGSSRCAAATRGRSRRARGSVSCASPRSWSRS
jgi:hypothetical protein